MRCASLVFACFVAGALAQEPKAPDKSAAAADQKVPVNMVIERILPFAEADRVHLEVHVRQLEGAGKARLGLTGIISDPEKREILWEGPIDVVALEGTKVGIARRTVANLKPRLWSLTEQPFYAVTIVGTWKDIASVRKTVRFAFRSFEVRNGQFQLNGKPIFLRGLALNPPLPGMGENVLHDIDFARAYVRELKRRNVNCIRTRGDTWLRACDLEGMLAVTGCFGPPPGSVVEGNAIHPPEEVDALIRRYKEDYFGGDVFHPSVVIHVLSQKMPNRGSAAAAFHGPLARCYRELKQWDPTRLVVSNAGVGDDRLGDIIDWSKYWGWYEGTYVDCFELAAESFKPMPVLLGECVGAGTGPSGRFPVNGVELAPSLAWCGHSGDPAADATQYQVFAAKHTIEPIRWLRRKNRRLGGTMLMTPLFQNWTGVNSLEEMKPKRVADQVALSYSPVLLSFENWTPNVYAGDTFKAIAHIVNDSDSFGPVCSNRLRYAVTDLRGRVIMGKEMPIPDVPYYAVQSRVIDLDLPRRMPTGRYLLLGRLTSASNVVCETLSDLFVADPRWATPMRPPLHIAAIYDPSGRTAGALRSLGVPTVPVASPAEWTGERALVIGAGALDACPPEQQQSLAEKIQHGGRILLLRQAAAVYKADWLPAKLTPSLKGREKWNPGMWINPERPGHAVFDGIPREYLRRWSDARGWTSTQRGYPDIFPAWFGLRLAEREDLAKTAVLANFGPGLANLCLCEVFDGEGSVVVSTFDCVARKQVDPVAARMLLNLVQYTANPRGHVLRPVIENPIKWGEYATESGLITGPLHGFLVSTASMTAGDAEGADGDKSDLGLPRGRRAVGPFTYDAQCRVVEHDPESPVGDAVFFARVPDEAKSMVTTVENPSKTNALVTVALNGLSREPQSVAAGETVKIAAPLPESTRDVDVRYLAPKDVVFLETEFR